MPITISLVIFGAHMNILVIIKIMNLFFSLIDHVGPPSITNYG